MGVRLHHCVSFRRDGSCAVNVVVCVKGDTALLSVKSLALGVFLVLREKALEARVVFIGI